MATSKPAPSGKITPKTPQIVSGSEKQALDQEIERRVSERAYSLYEASGRENGNDQAHWLQAEAEVLQRGLEIRESGSWLSIHASLPDVSAEDLRIYLEPNRVIVRAEKNGSETASSRAQGPPQGEFFLIEDLKAEIAPPTASASFKDQKLTLMVQKRHPANPPKPDEGPASR
jgi:HSP20 family molecular chaperone IbpA